MGYTLLNSKNTTKEKFFDAIEQLLYEFKYCSSLYSRYSVDYYKRKNIDEGYKIKDESFVIMENETVYCAFLGNIRTNRTITELQFYDLPSLLIENSPILNKNLRKNYYKELDKLMAGQFDKAMISGIASDGLCTYGIDYLLTNKKLSPEIRLKRNIYLDKPEVEIILQQL